MRSTSVVRPGDIVLDVGAGSGILSVFAARAGAARVYAVERTSVAVLAQELAAANGVAEIVQVIHGDVMDVELPERVDVIVSEWLGGFGIDEGMLVPVIVARDRWLKPGGVMIPRLVTAWAALVHDRYLAEMVEFLRDNPYGLRFDDLVEKTVNEIFYSGTFRHLAARDRRSEAGRLWTTDADLIPLQQAQAPHEAETLLPVRDHGTANALALWFSAELAPGISLSVGPGDPPTHWGMTTAPLRCAREAHARHVRPRQSEDRPSPADRDMDELGHRAARRRLGGARRAGGLAGDRRLSNPKNPHGARQESRAGRSSRRPGRWGHRSLFTVPGEVSLTGGWRCGRGLRWGPADQFDEAERDQQQGGDHDGHHGDRAAPEDEDHRGQRHRRDAQHMPVGVGPGARPGRWTGQRIRCGGAGSPSRKKTSTGSPPPPRTAR